MGFFVRAVRETAGGRAVGPWSAQATGSTLTPPPPLTRITPVDRGISVTDRGQILLELAPGDIVPAHPLDLAGRTLVFTPDGRGGYERSVRALAWEEDLGDPVDDKTEIEPSFPFDFAGQRWESFFVSRYGLVTFGEPYPFPQNGPDRWGTMQEIAVNLGAPPLIAALYKPQLGGRSTRNAEALGNVQHVSRRADRGPHHLDHHGRQFPRLRSPPAGEDPVPTGPPCRWPHRAQLRAGNKRSRRSDPRRHRGPVSERQDRLARQHPPTRWMGRFPATWTWWKPASHDCRSGSRAGRVHDARTHPGDPGPDTVL